MNTALPPVIADGADRPALRDRPSRLYVEVTTRCNLRCEMCVKESLGQGIREGHMSRETFARLAPALPGLDALVLNGIGEPLLHPLLEEFIETARRAMPPTGWVGFQTNGQLLGAARARSLAEAGVDRICISADSVSPEMFRTLRKGGRQEAIEVAVASLQAAARWRGRPISLGVEFVAMKQNLHQLADVVRWAARNRLQFAIVTHMLPYADETSGEAAYDPATDEVRALFRRWRDRAASEGVDLGRYFEVFLKFRPTDAEQRIVAFVKEMVADAAAQGLSVSVERLLRADESLERRVRDTFAEAEEVARREGLELRLPSVAPTRSRHCDFVEGGGAFVSWDGGVHPCYFLWHRYSCHVGGIVKHVEPRSFGSVAEEDVLALWNGAAARSFREGVLRYDFPFCYDCGLALCDYVKTGEFTEDCHVRTVPCSACLWCTGVFRCLS